MRRQRTPRAKLQKRADMLRQFSDIKNFALAAQDGEIGKIKELYFDAQSWVTRYLVVDTGGWLSGRTVLIGPRSPGDIDPEKQSVVVNLTRKEVEESPLLDTTLPLTREHEESWHRHFGYPHYWLTVDDSAFGLLEPQAERERPTKNGDPNLRSTTVVSSYAVHATDGDIGTIDDFIVDDRDWVIRYVVITRGWFVHKKVVLGTEWIDDVNAAVGRVLVPLQREAIRDAPEWDGREPITREFEVRLHDYYGRKGYWPIDV